MINNLFKISFIAIFLVVLAFSNNLFVKAAEKDAVLVVYASWSVVSRDLRPVAKSVAKDFEFPYVEYDIDNSNTQSSLRDLRLSVPTQTPYVVVLKDGSIVFKKAYPNSTPDLLKKDLTGILAGYR
jgi:hypothetical protein